MHAHSTRRCKIIVTASNRITGVVNGRQSSLIAQVDVVVSSPDGQSTVLKNGLSFLPLPGISGISVRGTDLVVIGDGFDRGSMPI